MLEKTTGFSRQTLEALSRQRGEPGWLHELRLEAFEAFEAAPLPDNRTEGWRRTPLTGLNLARLSVDPTGGPRLSSNVPAGGARVLSLADALMDAELNPRVRNHFAKVVPIGSDKFTALHYAFFNAGAVVHVPRNAAVPEPIEILFESALPGDAALPHVLLLADAGASANVQVAYRSSEGAPRLASDVIEVVQGAQSDIRVVQIQAWDSGTHAFSWEASRLPASASLRTLTVALGGRLSRNTVQVFLDGNGSQADILGVATGTGRQHVDFLTLQDHFGTNTRSDLVIHNALSDASSSNFAGLIRINKESRLTESSQQQKNVLLSERSTANSDPRLEILNNDVVRCTHGASVGPVDREAIFYLQSRGLDAQAAERIVIEGFLQTVVAHLQQPVLQADAWRAIRTKLHGGTDTWLSFEDERVVAE